MPLVLGGIVFVGLIVSILFLQIRQSDQLANRNLRELQVRLLQECSFRFAKRRMETLPGKDVASVLSPRMVLALSSDWTVRIDSRLSGLFLEIAATPLLRGDSTGPMAVARIAQVLPSGWPTLVLESHTGLARAGNADLGGKLLSTGGCMAFSGSAFGRNGPGRCGDAILDSSHSAWKDGQIDWERLEQGVDSLMRRRRAADNACSFKSGTHRGGGAYCRDSLILGGSVVWQGGFLVGRRVVIEGNAILHGTTVLGTESVTGRGNAKLGGQFVSLGDFDIDLYQRQEDVAWMAVADRTGGTSGRCTGRLRVHRLAGTGALLHSNARCADPSMDSAAIDLSDSVRWEGVVASNGSVRARGKVRGWVRVKGFRDRSVDGVWWNGVVSNFELSQLPDTARGIPLPPLFSRAIPFRHMEWDFHPEGSDP